MESGQPAASAAPRRGTGYDAGRSGIGWADRRPRWAAIDDRQRVVAGRPAQRARWDEAIPTDGPRAARQRVGCVRVRDEERALAWRADDRVPTN